MNTNTVPGSQRSILLIVKIFSQITRLMLPLLHRVYKRSKQSSRRNGKQRNFNETALLKKMQVNLQFAEKCLQDVNKVIGRWTNASPQKWDLGELCL
jgi:hypothetical protein